MTRYRSTLVAILLSVSLAGALRAPAVPQAPPAGAEPAAATTIDALAWMAGYWVRDAEGGRRVEELWLPPAGGVMLGLHRDVRADGRVWFEFLRLAAEERGLVYWASLAGQPATPFHLVEAGERRAVFANPEHDFPQRILYWLDGGGELHARIEGEENGVARSSEWSWRRSAFP